MAPPSDTIKTNFDASLRSAESKCSLGGLARTSNGKCVVWFSYCLKQNLDPVVAEAMAALKAVKFALARQFFRIVLEGDSSTLVAAIRCKEGLRTSYGNLIADIKRLATHFEEFEVCYVKRDGNRAAHEIARLSSMSTFSANVLPAAISDIVMSDSQ
ncbi:PREDICTED: uncharacterized protein LOC105968309 [Erythranthe guttata]|uniref:uncharacterized protein LOC105968309 n=1 Tax=Erythranthe guttata TaxID=4155 RepID=UPI00064DB7A9|nr:PREDICTED: uncharacterized protein LOC105968309 [Erythranthe guttata]|eukprot:XP_012848396.1 PREDICTED: uncharacterized protein LOC105968309 [Erythranthe guttata]